MHVATGMTSSPAFQQALQEDFVCETKADTGKWPMIADELTIWRRKDAADRVDTVDPKPRAVNLRFCAVCHFDDAPHCGHREDEWFCTLSCKELHAEAARTY